MSVDSLSLVLPPLFSLVISISMHASSVYIYIYALNTFLFQYFYFISISVPSGTCTKRKSQLCDNAYFLVTGSSDKRAKCCPDTSGCVKDQLVLESNSVCSTKCGACMGTISEKSAKEPIVFCAFEDSDRSESAGLKNCYDDITKPLCEEKTNPPLDVGKDKCPGQVEGGTAGCEVEVNRKNDKNDKVEVVGKGLVCCDTVYPTQKTCDAGGTSFSTYSTDLFSILELAQCQPEEEL